MDFSYLNLEWKYRKDVATSNNILVTKNNTRLIRPVIFPRDCTIPNSSKITIGCQQEL